MLFRSDSGERKSDAVRRKSDMASYESFIRAAGDALGDAKHLHDDLEALYRPAVDFSSIDALLDRHCEDLLEDFRHKKRDFRS